MTNYSRSELKRLAREALLGNYTVLILALLTTSAVPTMLLTPFSIGLTAEFNFAMVTYLLAAILVKVLCGLFSVGVERMQLLLAQEQQISYMDLFWAFRNKPDRFLMAALLLVAVLCIPAVPAAAGVVWLVNTGETAGYWISAAVLLLFFLLELYILYFFDLVYLYFIEQEEITVIQGVRAVIALLRGNEKRLFALQLGFLGWQMLGVLSFGIGMLWIQPYITQTTVNFYLDLTGGLERV